MKRILRNGIYATAFILLSVGIHAQTLQNTQISVIPYTDFTDTGAESVDSVTVGSRMPYRVEAQTNVPAGLDVEYKWLFSSASTVEALSLTTSPLTGDGDYYTANEISVVMPSTTGNITINTNVRYKSGGTALCAGEDDDEYNVMVVDRPKISWTAGEIISCVSMPVTIPVGVTGYKQFEIAYKIDYYNNFDSSGTPVSTNEWVVLAGNNLIFPKEKFTSTGVYKITVTNITDRISRKSLDMSLVEAKPGDLPTGAYTVKIYPAPTTKPLQHVKNVQ